MMRAVLIVALASVGATMGPAMAMQREIINVPAKAAKPGNRGVFNDAVLPTGYSAYGRKGAGVSMASQKRASAKRRNVKRNRAAHRG